MTEDTITKDEINFAKDAITYGQPVILARSRCDMNLENQKKMNEIPEVNQDAADKFVKES